MAKKTESFRNREWEYRMEIYGMMVLITIILIWGAIGWHRYREERIVKEELETVVENFYESLGGI